VRAPGHTGGKGLAEIAPLGAEVRFLPRPLFHRSLNQEIPTMPQKKRQMVALRGFLYQGQRIMRGEEIEVSQADVSWLSQGKSPLAKLDEGDAAEEATTEENPVRIDIGSASRDELEAEVERLNLTDQVEGTGANGNIVMEDLRRTLRACC
jgi:hypothetical protein